MVTNESNLRFECRLMPQNHRSMAVFSWYYFLIQNDHCPQINIVMSLK